MVGRITHHMGDLHRRTETADMKAEAKKESKKRQRAVVGDSLAPSSKRMKLTGPSSVLATDTLEGIHYQPRKRETRAAYQELLQFVEGCLGDQQLAIVMSAADEVLSFLKDENMRPAQRQKEVSTILGRWSWTTVGQAKVRQQQII